LAAALMGAFIAGAVTALSASPGITGTMAGRVAVLSLLVVAGLGLYLACLQALGVASVQRLVQAVREQI
jgi:hypothetical protein